MHHYPQHTAFHLYDPYRFCTREYPRVDTSIFAQSVMSFQKVMTEVSNLLHKLSEPSFARKIMTAAQQGKQHEVDQLIRSTGITYAVTTSYTPTGIVLVIHIDAHGTLTMFLRWGR